MNETFKISNETNEDDDAIDIKTELRRAYENLEKNNSARSYGRSPTIAKKTCVKHIFIT